MGVLMPSYLGEFARATLKAAVINAENRNRLNEEDKCWREKSDKREKRSHTSKNANKYENNRPLVTVDRIKSKRNIDKWDHEGFYTNHPEEVGPSLPAPPQDNSGPNPDRFRFFAKPPDVAIVQNSTKDENEKSEKLRKSRKRKKIEKMEKEEKKIK